MNLLFNAIKEYLSCEKIFSDAINEIYISKVEKDNIIFDSIDVLIEMKIEIIAIEKMLKILSNYHVSKTFKWFTVYNIFVCSQKAGIYLYEAIVNDTIWKKDRLKKRLCVFNIDDGLVCIKPGSIYNRVISERIRYLLDEYKNEIKDDWNKEMKNVFDAMKYVMKGVK